MIAFYWYVLCIGILLSWHANDVMFLGSQANFGTQKNYATGTKILGIFAVSLNPIIIQNLIKIKNASKVPNNLLKSYCEFEGLGKFKMMLIVNMFKILSNH